MPSSLLPAETQGGTLTVAESRDSLPLITSENSHQTNVVYYYYGAILLTAMVLLATRKYFVKVSLTNYTSLKARAGALAAGDQLKFPILTG
jgi:hypothetical protein